MEKVALIFPGQGSQYVGMAKDIYDNNEVAKKVIDNACDILGVDIKKIMFDGSLEELSKTENTQPAILIHSIALLKAIDSEIDLKYDACLGLSLGEYSALVVAEAIQFEEALPLVKKRGCIMQEAVPIGKGAMAAILGLDRDKVKNVIDGIENGIVEIANYNSPGQIVISGECHKVEEAMERLKEIGARKTIKLNVSGPFHSSMLRGAGVRLAKELNNIKINQPKVDVISNANAKRYDRGYRDLLVNQVSSSVLWEDSIEKLLDEGYKNFIEIGPGKTLKPFVKKIASRKGAEINTYNIDDLKSLEGFIEMYKNGGLEC